MADLTKRDITDVYVCGLAYDFCVGQTATDAQSLGYRTMLIEDAVRGADIERIAGMRQALLQAGCILGQAHEEWLPRCLVSGPGIHSGAW
ncbi:nicotinamidase-like [Patiria miniata]|uniref:nicotinamidase n=1 Tax=Patiria miniata TaxID=46514 RepID=A0A913ZU12_PATMI|nr:nicotinamidase-like [Patiria miniata]